MAQDWAASAAQEAGNGPFVSLLCREGHHDLCVGVDAECGCRCHRPEDEEDYPFSEEQ